MKKPTSRSSQQKLDYFLKLFYCFVIRNVGNQGDLFKIIFIGFLSYFCQVFHSLTYLNSNQPLILPCFLFCMWFCIPSPLLTMATVLPYFKIFTWFNLNLGKNIFCVIFWTYLWSFSNCPFPHINQIDIPPRNFNMNNTLSYMV